MPLGGEQLQDDAPTAWNKLPQKPLYGRDLDVPSCVAPSGSSIQYMAHLSYEHLLRSDKRCPKILHQALNVPDDDCHRDCNNQVQITLMT
jgi:hypothetical protein